MARPPIRSLKRPHFHTPGLRAAKGAAAYHQTAIDAGVRSLHNPRVTQGGVIV